MRADTEPIDLLETSNLGSKTLEDSEADENVDSSLGKELTLPTKPLSFTFENPLPSP